MTSIPSALRHEPSPVTVIVGLLGVSGLGCVGIGLAALLSPAASASLIGYEFATVGGRVEFLTFYGGFYLGIGLFLLAATRRPQLRPGATAFLALSATAAIPVRIGSLIQYDVAEPLFYGLLLGEITFAAVGWFGWYWITTSGREKESNFPGGIR